MQQRIKYIGSAACLILLLCSGCMSVKEYQKMYLNDKRMDTAASKAEKFEIGFESYREGAAGASGGKSGGGCRSN